MKGWAQLRQRYPSLPVQPTTGIIGIDEVGLGCWAGPTLVCGVLAPSGFELPGLTDSKQLSSKRHELYDRQLREHPDTRVCLVAAGNSEIDEVGIRRVLRDCTLRVAQELLAVADGLAVTVVLDGIDEIPGIHSYAMPKADSLVQHVSAASVIAKHAKDVDMLRQEERYPGYGFASNSGYCSPTHTEGLKRLGVCPIHRRSYRPIQEALGITTFVCVRGNTQWTGPECATVIFNK